MTHITIDRALLEQAMNMIPPTTAKKIALKSAIRAELAKPVEQAEYRNNQPTHQQRKHHEH